VESRVIAETGGNPLALIQLPMELTPAQLAGVSALPEPLPIRGRLEQSFLRRVRGLPAATQTLLLLLAAEPGPDPDLFWRAAGRLDLASDDAQAAEDEGLVSNARHLAFRHPLVRSAVYGAALPDERRRVHRALAVDVSPIVDPDRTVWHRAAAAVGPDEDVAAELEGSANERDNVVATQPLPHGSAAPPSSPPTDNGARHDRSTRRAPSSRPAMPVGQRLSSRTSSPSLLIRSSAPRRNGCAARSTSSSG